jgi:hypothetical protein
MKNEFIPYEQALALKGLGFDEPCFGYYSIDSLNLKSPTFNLEKPFEYEWCLPAQPRNPCDKHESKARHQVSAYTSSQQDTGFFATLARTPSIFA